MSVDKRVTEDLIETLQDGKDGFAHAAEKLAESGQTDLSAKMQSYSMQRSQFSTELDQLAAAYGDDVDEDGSAGAAIHRAWMSVKDALSGSDPKGVLDAAETGEDHAMSEYRDALSKDISAGLRTVVQRQFDDISKAHSEIKDLRSTFS